jgi:hypothetical protein
MLLGASDCAIWSSCWFRLFPALGWRVEVEIAGRLGFEDRLLASS